MNISDRKPPTKFQNEKRGMSKNHYLYDIFIFRPRVGNHPVGASRSDTDQKRVGDPQETIKDGRK